MPTFQLLDWAKRHMVSRDALEDLVRTLNPLPTGQATGSKETPLLRAVSLTAAGCGDLLFRNNRGVALNPDTGRAVRFGLANDSAQIGKRLASHDLIGIRADGRFLSVEVKAPGWKPTPSAVNPGQENWTALIRARNGIAMTVNSVEQYVKNRR